MMQQDQKRSKNNILRIRAVEEQRTATRTKQHEDEEEDTGTRPAGREKIREHREKHGKKEQNKQARQVSLLPLSRSPH